MANILRAGAAVQMVLGAAGFLATLGFYAWMLLKPLPTALSHPLAVFGLALLFAFLFNIGGMLWLSVHSTYRPRHDARPAPPPSPAG